MSLSVVNQPDAAVNAAIEATIARYAGESAATVATVLTRAKQYATERKGIQGGLFVALLDQAATARMAPELVRATGAVIRRAVTEEMRAAVNLPRVKVKGTKESGAPDFSTASVYAKSIADAMTYRAQRAELWRAACKAVDNKEVAIPVHEASGLFATRGGLSRAVAKFEEMRAEEIKASAPALFQSSATAAPSMADMQAELARLRSALSAYEARRVGDAETVGERLQRVEAERDQLADELAAIRAETAETAETATA